jgi:hypothetical protein
MTQWRIRIQGKRRAQVNSELLVQAVLALGRLLAEEQRQAETEAPQADPTEKPEVTP